MHQKTAGYFLCCIVAVTLLLGCKKFEKQGFLQQPGIAMTFDDNYVDNWIRYLPFLDSAGIKATFYISNYNRLTAKQIQDLHVIQNHGHEIAYHTVNHYNMVDYVYKYHHSVEDLMQKEIVAGLKMMQKDGFY
ncbi:MAG: polysaccharide deacetylase family protein, partial [Ferruginibacter sp.]